MSKRPSEWTDADERRYWRGMRESYLAKQERLESEPGYWYCDPYSFYGWIFPDGFLEAPGEQVDWDEPGGGKPNAIALVITDEMRKLTDKQGVERERPRIVRHAFHDGFSDLDDGDLGEVLRDTLDKNWTVLLSPVSFFGRRRCASNARFLHAFVVDLDGVGVEQLGNLLKQIWNGRTCDERTMWTGMPQPSAIVNSGRGLHLWYVLDRPIPLLPKVVPFLQRMKRCLTDIVWTEYTSTIPLDKKQYQGIYQGFRAVGSTTRLNGLHGGSKRERKYVTTAYRYEPEAGRPWTVSLDYLLKWCGLARGGGDEALEELKNLYLTGGRTPMARAKELWPEWYQRRIVEEKEPGRWVNKRDLYDWWLRTIQDGATVHHRYWCINDLAACAKKCGISFEELESDAYSLVPLFNEMRDEDGKMEGFTDADCAAALDYYYDPDAHRITRAAMERHSGIAIPANKRNGRKQPEHLKLARFARDLNLGAGEWINKEGAPTKCNLVRSYAAEHPQESHSRIAAALGVSRTTVIKWLKPGWQEEWEKAKKADEESGDLDWLHTITPIPLTDDQIARIPGAVAVRESGGEVVGLNPGDLSKVMAGLYDPGEGNFIFELVRDVPNA